MEGPHTNVGTWAPSYLATLLLKLWVATRKRVLEQSHMGRENAICKSINTIMTSVSLPTNKIGPLCD